MKSSTLNWLGRRAVVSQVRKLTPVTIWLIVVVIINLAVINGVLLLAPSNQQGLRQTYRYFQGRAGTDSWWIMDIAVDYLSKPQDKTVYSELFFDRKIKFQYPPTSLLFLSPINLIESTSLGQFVNINRISWVAVLINGFIVARIFTLSMKQYLQSNARQTSLDQVLQWCLAIVISLSFYPIIKAYTLGQIQVWINCIFAALVLLSMNRISGSSGVLTGIISLMKPQLGLLVIWGLLRKQYRFSWGWILIVIPVLVLSIFTYGLASHVDYLEVLSYISRHGEGYYPNQSMNGLLNRLFLNGNNLTWQSELFAPFHLWVYVGTLVSSLVLIGFALFWKREEHQGASSIDLTIAALTFTMASPVAWEHHYGILLPIFAVALPATFGAKLGARGAVFLALSFLLSSNFYFIANRSAETPFNFVQSYLFFGGVMLLVHLYRLRGSLHRMRSRQYPAISSS